MLLLPVPPEPTPVDIPSGPDLRIPGVPDRAMSSAGCLGPRDAEAEPARDSRRKGRSVMQQRITPNLWFDTQAEEAAQFYTSVFKNSRVVSTTHYTEAGPRPAGMVMTVEFELDGQRFVGINGGPEFTFDE